MVKKKEHHKIEWFEKLRLNSWEVEILIVGFVLVILFQAPATIDFNIDVKDLLFVCLIQKNKKINSNERE